MKGLIEEIRKLGNIILVIDEVHNIVGAGDAEGSMNAANILKPALSRGELQVIGLDEALVVVGLEPDHQLAEGNDFCHDLIPPE